MTIDSNFRRTAPHLSGIAFTLRKVYAPPFEMDASIQALLDRLPGAVRQPAQSGSPCEILLATVSPSGRFPVLAASRAAPQREKRFAIA